jgi:hypothetical protein
MTTHPDEAPEQPPTQQEVSILEAATILGKSPATIRRMITRGELTAVKATTPTGFVYRIRLPTAEDAGPGLLTRQEGLRSLEGFVQAFRSELSTLVEANDRHVATIKEQEAEIARLRMEVAYARRSLWQRLVDLVKP